VLRVFMTMGAATDALKREHEEIKAMMAVLRRMSGEMENGRTVLGADLRAALSFFEIIADRIHHAKEEDLLVPALVAKGFPLVGGPLCTYFRSLETIRDPLRDEVCETSRLLGEPPPNSPDAPIPILEEHQLGRNLVRLMRRAAEGGNATDFVRRAGRFLEMLAEHIDKEDRCLFPMADDTLDAQEQRNLEAAFRAFDERAKTEFSLRRRREEWEALREAYGPIN
jgi:hemerythrin-like domain-containing protein